MKGKNKKAEKMNTGNRDSEKNKDSVKEKKMLRKSEKHIKRLEKLFYKYVDKTTEYLNVAIYILIFALILLGALTLFNMYYQFKIMGELNAIVSETTTIRIPGNELVDGALTLR